MYIKWMDKDAPRFTESLPYHPFIHSFIQQVCIEHLLYAIHIGGARDTAVSQTITIFRKPWALLHIAASPDHPTKEGVVAPI